MEANGIPDIDVYDGLQIWRCPQLGGPVTFKYCRVMNERLPCPRIVSCWGASLDVTAYLEQHFSPEQLEKVFGAPPKDRWTRIVETLDKVKHPKEE